MVGESSQHTDTTQNILIHHPIKKKDRADAKSHLSLTISEPHRPRRTRFDTHLFQIYGNGYANGKTSRHMNEHRATGWRSDRSEKAPHRYIYIYIYIAGCVIAVGAIPAGRSRIWPSILWSHGVFEDETLSLNTISQSMDNIPLRFNEVLWMGKPRCFLGLNL